MTLETTQAVASEAQRYRMEVRFSEGIHDVGRLIAVISRLRVRLCHLDVAMNDEDKARGMAILELEIPSERITTMLRLRFLRLVSVHDVRVTTL
jgi:acetolactate synthase regulatory subunit